MQNFYINLNILNSLTCIDQVSNTAGECMAVREQEDRGEWQAEGRAKRNLAKSASHFGVGSKRQQLLPAGSACGFWRT
jgi:hypothetical protein